MIPLFNVGNIKDPRLLFSEKKNCYRVPGRQREIPGQRTFGNLPPSLSFSASARKTITVSSLSTIRRQPGILLIW